MASGFERPYNIRPLIKRFFVSTEGGATEPDYLKRLNGAVGYGIVRIEPLSDRQKSAPSHVLARILKVEKGKLRKHDELWCVIDRDDWERKDIQTLIDWAAGGQGEIHRGFVLNSPKFELWLLAHFEELVDNPNVTRRAVVAALCRHLPDYEKGNPGLKVTLTGVREAIARCRQAYGDELPAEGAVGTNMHVLAEAILEASEAR